MFTKVKYIIVFRKLCQKHAETCDDKRVLTVTVSILPADAVIDLKSFPRLAGLLSLSLELTSLPNEIKTKLDAQSLLK